MTLIIALSIIATVSIIAGVAMGGRKVIEPMPVARYDRFVGPNHNRPGEN